MSSAFLVFDLIRRNASPERSVTPEVASIQNLMTVKKRSGLSSEKRVSRVPAGKASPKATGLITAMLFRLVRLQQGAGNYRVKSISSCLYLLSFIWVGVGEGGAPPFSLLPIRS